MIEIHVRLPVDTPEGRAAEVHVESSESSLREQLEALRAVGAVVQAVAEMALKGEGND